MTSLNWCSVSRAWMFGDKDRITRREITHYLVCYRDSLHPSYLKLASLASRDDERFFNFAYNWLIEEGR